LYKVIGDAFYGEQKWDEAIDAYRKAVEADPNASDPFSSGVRVQFARILRQRRKLDEAVDAYRKAIEAHSSESGMLRSELASVLHELGRMDEAMDLLRQAVEIDPRDAHAYETMAVVLGAMKKHDDAVASYRKAIELDPKRVTLYIALGNALYDWRQLDDAVVVFGQALEVDPKSLASVHAHVARMSTDQSLDLPRRQAYMEQLMAALEGGRPNEVAWQLATNPEPGLRDPARAVELAKRAIARAPKDADAWNTLGIARYRSGDFKASIAALEKYRELRTNIAEWSNPFFLAMAHWRLGHKDEALGWYEKASEWMNKHARTSESLIRFRSEAAELLGVSEKK
jgi:tetratricopeptide (TPR) repeat protein